MVLKQAHRRSWVIYECFITKSGLLVMDMLYEVTAGSTLSVIVWFERERASERYRERRRGRLREPHWHYFPLILFALHLAGILMMEK